MCKFLPGRGLPGHKGVYVGRRPINSASMDKRTIIVVLTFSARPRLHARKSIEHISILGASQIWGLRRKRELMPSIAEEQASKSKHRLSAIATPAHASLFHTRLDNGLACGLNGAAADREALLSKRGVVHAMAIAEKIANGLSNGFRHRRHPWIKASDLAEEIA